MESNLTWRGRNRAKLVVTFVSILLSVTFLEAGLQVYYRLTRQSWLWSYNAFHVTYVDKVDDRRAYALRKGFYDDRLGVSINQKGFRTSKGVPEVEPSVPVIALLGDSKAFGTGVRDNETYPFILDEKLASGRPVLRAVNAGVPSYNSRQVIDRFHLDILPSYNVKIVVFHAAFNDISLLTFYREQWNPDRTWADIRYRGFKPPIEAFQRSAILFFANLLFSRQNDDSPLERAKSVKYESFSDREMMVNLRWELEVFLAECDQRSIPVILLPIDPFYYQTMNEDKNESLPLWKANHEYFDIWKEMVQDYDSLLIEESEKHKSVYFLDTRKLLDAEDRSRLFVDAVHYSAEGNKVVANGLHDFLIREKLIER